MGKIRFHVLPLPPILALGLAAWLAISAVDWRRQAPLWPAQAPPAEPPAVAVGRAAPDFTLAELDGKPVSLAGLRGQPVVLLFWADWCPECDAALQHLADVKAGAPRELRILAINIMQGPEKVAEQAGKHSGSITFVLDSDAAVSNLYNVRAVPAYYFINRDGILVGRVSGAGREPLVEGYVWHLLATPGGRAGHAE